MPNEQMTEHENKVLVEESCCPEVDPEQAPLLGRGISRSRDRVEEVIAMNTVANNLKSERYCYIEMTSEDFNARLLRLRQYVKTETLDRKLARFLSSFRWYYPQKGDPHLSLEKAWAYFEHVTLPRYFVMKGQENEKQDTIARERAGAGESDFLTELYAPFATPERQLGSFGIGIGVYFSNLRW